MRRACFVLVGVWLGLAGVGSAQQGLNSPRISVVASASELEALAPAMQAVEVGGSIEGEHVDLVAGPRQPKKQWFLGAYWRHLWVPSIFQGLFFDVTPSISNGIFGLDPTVGVVATLRNPEGFSIVFGLGYMSYEFEGPFRADGDPIRDTEIVVSDLSFWHGTASFLWSTKLHDMFAVEYGFGLDLGLVFGDLERTEAYPDDDGEWQACEAPGDPDTETAEGDPYCEPTRSGAETDPSDEFGAHYGAKVGKLTDDGKIPNVMLFPAVPHLALRFSPIEEMDIKLEFAYGIAQLWVGISAHGEIASEPERPKVPSELRVVTRPLGPKGRVLGLVLEQGTDTPVPGASVAFPDPEVSPLLTREDGRFTSAELDPGEIVLELSHEEYEPGTCKVIIPELGGDVEARCELVALPRVGIIDGRVVGPTGPIAGAQVELSGPMTSQLVTDEWGIFKVEQAEPGDYKALAKAEGYLSARTEFTVDAGVTANIQITMAEEPKLTMVKVEEREIKIERKVHFATNKAEIKPESFPLLQEVTKVFESYSEIRLVEVQGHTDSRGSDAYNMKLSQRRADAVRNWLISAGVSADRLVAKGYGESIPVASNRNRDGRSRNRRVQFMILERAESE